MIREVSKIRTRESDTEILPVYARAEVTPEVQARTTDLEARNYARWVRELDTLLTRAGFPMLGTDEMPWQVGLVDMKRRPSQESVDWAKRQSWFNERVRV